MNEMNKWMDGEMDGWMNRTNGWRDQQMGGGRDGRMDEGMIESSVCFDSQENVLNIEDIDVSPYEELEEQSATTNGNKKLTTINVHLLQVTNVKVIRVILWLVMKQKYLKISCQQHLIYHMTMQQ